MKKFFSLLILILSAMYVNSQPTQPTAPAACNAANCTTNSSIDVCPQQSNNVIGVHQSAVYNRGNNGNNLGVNAVWRYRNIATVAGITVNAELTIDAISNAVLDNIDDDAATDQDGNSITSFFAPRIGTDQCLNGTDRRGYVQFTMTFYKNATGVNNGTNADFAVSAPLANLNYVHYDIDGNDADDESTGNAGSWFRETGVAKRVSLTNPAVLANAPTELVSYNYTEPAATTWTGFAGSVCEKTGVSRCAQVAASYSYAGSQPSITFRMGYDYNAGGNIGTPVRQYGSRLGCFNFPTQIQLPVKLLNFTGAYKNQHTLLSWATENEINFDRFEAERSSNGSDFSGIGIENAKTGSSGKNQYELNDDLSNSNGKVFYYRLKMVDQQERFSYSQVIAITKDNKSINGISISPNPVPNGMATVKMTAAKRGSVELRITDFSGKILARQSRQVYEGNNSITLNVQHLQPGIYTLQMMDGTNMVAARFSIVR
jgi:hypothetical protein